MLITAFSAEGFRSLRDVKLEGLGPFNVFYGRNGAGKSNILAAIDVWAELTRLRLRRSVSDSSESFNAGNDAQKQVLRTDDFSKGPTLRPIKLGARLSFGADVFHAPPAWLKSVAATTTLSFSGSRPRLDVSVVAEFESTTSSFDSERLTELQSKAVLDQPTATQAHQLAEQVLSVLQRSYPGFVERGGYSLIGANRAGTSDQDASGLLDEHLRHGRISLALKTALLSPDPEIRARYEALRQLLSGPPLNRPPFAPVENSATNRVEIRETLRNRVGLVRDLPLDLAGLGIAQIYSILAKAMLSRARCIGIEEPEAHLHAPTSGRHLRELLVRLVVEKHADQLFIATHSNLFDLDPNGYFDVDRDEDGWTRVERRPLTDLEDRHLYEPGPALHALRQLLSHIPSDEIVFRRPDGSPIDAKQMLQLLQADDELALRFLRDVNDAAVSMVRVKNKKAAPK